ncbi:MAG: cytochrome c [Candidatus Tectomicrobia bacterium]|nr:cytochrome c [Candidatus Tectomicrobia bacterium]
MLLGLLACLSTAGAGVARAETTPTAESLQKTYAALCATCHGEKGDGKGPAAPGLMPRPTDFTNARFMARFTDAYLADVIRSGKLAVLRRGDSTGLSSNSMPAFEDVLSSNEITALADMVESLAERGGSGGEAVMLSSGAMPVYRRFCASCHGMLGGGDSPLASGLQPPPTDFNDRQDMSRFSRRYLIDMVTHGKTASIERLGYATMAPFGAQLDEAAVKGLIAFLRSFSKPGQ